MLVYVELMKAQAKEVNWTSPHPSDSMQFFFYFFIFFGEED